MKPRKTVTMKTVSEKLTCTSPRLKPNKTDWETQTERSRKSARRLHPKPLTPEEREEMLKKTGFNRDSLLEVGADIIRLQRLGRLMRYSHNPTVRG